MNMPTVRSPRLAISDLRVFGTGGGHLPAVPQGFTARRQPDARNADVAWQPVPGAVGYNIRWGIGKDKLTRSGPTPRRGLNYVPSVRG